MSIDIIRYGANEGWRAIALATATSVTLPLIFGCRHWLAQWSRQQRAAQSAMVTLQKRADQLRTQNQILIQLAKHPAINQGHLVAAAHAVTTATACTIQVQRVSVWLYRNDNTELVCVDLFEQSHNQHSDGLVLPVAAYPAYFHALSTEDLVVAHNTQTDPRTREFVDGYLTPLAIASMLDAPIRVSGQTVGVLCIEHVGTARLWSPEDENFARSVADLLSLALEARDRMTVEAALRQQAEALERALQELRQTQLQMIQSEKMSSLGQMVAGVAHEINNPVNFIHGNLSHASDYIRDLLGLIALYQQLIPDPPAAIQAEIEAIDLEFLTIDLTKILQSMRVGTERIREIVLSLRIFSRLDEAEVKEIDLHAGIDSTLTILHNRLKAKPERPEIQVIKDYDNLPLVECYAGQINQVFMNILSNAIDALEQPHPEPSQTDRETQPRQIQIRTELTPHDWIVIRIADNGPGITETVSNRLFDPFFTTKPVGKGTGLGLSISYQIITEKHQGRLWCNSYPGKGAEFVIEIPVQQKLNPV